MNSKDIIVSFGLAFVMWFSFNYFFFGSSSVDQAESSFVAPKEKRMYKPLNTEVDFIDNKKFRAAEHTTIETDWAILDFSTNGASLESVDFKREINGSLTTIRALFPVSDTEKADRCFLVALDEKTPFYYDLTSFNDRGSNYQLTYQVHDEDCAVQKTFTVHKDKPKIDLMLNVITKKNQQLSITPRIFFPAPLMSDIKDTDLISSIVIDQHGVFAKKGVAQLDIHRGWFTPELFGSDSRYFIYSLISDTDKFAQRAYYKLENRDRLFSIVEGPAVTESTSWNMSFYFGPKDLDVINQVDTRLELTFDHGIFSLIAKIMLKLIKWFYRIFDSYGLAIIAVTCLIQLLLLPFNIRNGEEKFRKQQMVYQQKLAIIKQRFKDQPEKLAAEQAALLRSDGMPSLGCLIPLLLQIPIFFALNRVLSSSFELYQAPMLWIRDLSVKDPYYILPLLMALTMFIPDGKTDSQQQINTVMKAVLFGVLMSNFAAGLVLYFVASRIFGLMQSRVIKYFNLV